MKAERKPAPPAQKSARKTAAAPSGTKPTSSTSRKIRPVQENLRTGCISRGSSPSVASTIPSKAGDGGEHSMTSQPGFIHEPSRAIRNPAPTDLVEPSPSSQDPIQYPEEATRKVKTYLSAKQLREFKTILLEKRDQLAGDVERLTAEALKGNGRGYGDQSTMPIHMADLGSD